MPTQLPDPQDPAVLAIAAGYEKGIEAGLHIAVNFMIEQGLVSSSSAKEVDEELLLWYKLGMEQARQEIHAETGMTLEELLEQNRLGKIAEDKD